MPPNNTITLATEPIIFPEVIMFGFNGRAMETELSPHGKIKQGHIDLFVPHVRH